jgi:hypothetical protein
MYFDSLLLVALLDNAEDDEQYFFWFRSPFLVAYYLFFDRRDPVHVILRF